MKVFWSQDLFLKAFNFAAKAHGDQKIPGSDLPYITHVACVCAELMAVIDNTVDGDLILQCAALHDIIEDTEINYKDIFKEFGENIAEGVKSLSKNYNLAKEVQVEDSLSRILKQPKEIWMVKMADRIINLSQPPSFWTSEKKQRYFEQSKLIYNTFKNTNKLLDQRLNTRIDKYKYYI